jgi:hypothetical protein
MIELKRRFSALRRVADPEPRQEKYGKFIYSFNGADASGGYDVKIESKYPPCELLRR